jgi:hypothetical protein
MTLQTMTGTTPSASLSGWRVLFGAESLVSSWRIKTTNSGLMAFDTLFLIHAAWLVL